MQKITPARIAKAIGTWAPTLMLAFIFLNQGYAKFSATSGWARAFQHWGYPDWFRMTVGGLELLGALLLLWWRSAPIGAALIILVMAGAMGTHIVIDHRPREVFHETVPMVLALLVLVMRRNEARALLRWRT